MNEMKKNEMQQLPAHELEIIEGGTETGPSTLGLVPLILAPWTPPQQWVFKDVFKKYTL